MACSPNCMARVLEMRQVGCGMADGAGIVVSLVRSWAADIVSTDNADLVDPETILGVDLANAYGKAYRSTCMRGTRRRLPKLAPATPVWQRTDTGWRRSTSGRRGWQGSRLMQLTSAWALRGH